MHAIRMLAEYMDEKVVCVLLSGVLTIGKKA